MLRLKMVTGCREVMLLVVVLGGFTPPAAAQTVRGRALVLVDTSGSMVWHFNDCSSAGGDSGNAALFCDNNLGTGYDCSKACSSANGGLSIFPSSAINPSRLFGAKAALVQVVNAASGSIDFGLERFAPATIADYGVAICNDAVNCCAPASGTTTRGR